MTPRIVVFGATGYTGRLTAEALARRGARPLLAGRNADKLAELARALGGLPTRLADVTDPASVRALVGEGDVLVSTVGPFQRFGEAALGAALEARAHYIDSTGEPAFIRRVFQGHGEAATRAQVLVLTAAGYDYVPGNLAGALALRRAGAAARRIDVGYFVPGRFAASQGTLASSYLAALHPGMEFRAGHLVERYNGLRTRDFQVGGKRRAAVSVGGTEHYGLPPAFPHVRDVNVYLGWYGKRSEAMSRGARLLAGLRELPILGDATAALLTRLGPTSQGAGPDAPTRARMTSRIVALAYAGDGTELERVSLVGANGYDFTADFLAFAAERALGGELAARGAVGPVQAFGLDALEAGCAEAGLREESPA